MKIRSILLCSFMVFCSIALLTGCGGGGGGDSTSVADTSGSLPISPLPATARVSESVAAKNFIARQIAGSYSELKSRNTPNLRCSKIFQPLLRAAQAVETVRWSGLAGQVSVIYK